MFISNPIPMNLQLFGNSGDIESPVNAEPAVNVEPQETGVSVQPESVNGEVATPQESKPVQSAEENAKFAAIRREAETRAKEEAQKIIDAEYSRLYGEQYGIHSKAEYDKAVAEYEEQQRLQAEAERMQASPELLKEIEELKSFKNETLQKEQQKLHEENVKAIDKEVNDILEIAKKDGVSITKEELVKTAIGKGLTDLKDAYKLLKPDLDMETIKQNAVKEYIEKLKTGQAPVEASGASPSVIAETPRNFEDARKGAAAMLRAAKIFN